MTHDRAPGQIGRSIPRLEAREKVTAAPSTSHNLRLPGMLHGKIFRSTIPHGRIKRIDVAAARALDGVHAVVTIDDIRDVIPHPYYGPAFHDQPILADGKVRFAGEPVAVVLAADPPCRRGGGRADQGRVRGAAGGTRRGRGGDLVGDRARRAEAGGDLPRPRSISKGRRGTNVALDYQLRRGDADAAFAAADHVFEHTFRTQQVDAHAAGAVRRRRRRRRRTAHDPHRLAEPSFVRIEIARLLGWPENRVRVKVPYPRRRLRRQALHQARGAGHRAVARSRGGR